MLRSTSVSSKQAIRTKTNSPQSQDRSDKCVPVCVCASIWTHMLVCPWAQRAFEPQELISPIRISAGKRDKYTLQLEWTHRQTHTHYQEILRSCSSSALPPFFCDFFFFNFHLLWSKITGHYQRSWKQSLSLHYSPVLPAVLHHTAVFFPSLHTSSALSKPFPNLTHPLLISFQECGKPPCYFFGWFWCSASREGNFLGCSIMKYEQTWTAFHLTFGWNTLEMFV